MSAVGEYQTDTGRVLVRAFEAELAEGDGRTIDARIAPYNTPAIVADPPDFLPYQEMFLPGAFERQLRSPNRVRVWLNFEHEQGLRGIVGHGAELTDHADGLHGRFRVHENADGDKALQLVHEGVLTGLSLEFAAIRSRIVDGVTARVRAHIDKVALCRAERAAYELAQVLAVREGPDELDEGSSSSSSAPKPEALPLDAQLVERMERLGITPLGRLELSEAQWDASPDRFTAEEFARSTLLEGRLPVLEPDGALNVHALVEATRALTGARSGLALQHRAAAARKLIRYYRHANLEVPAGLVTLARS